MYKGLTSLKRSTQRGHNSTNIERKSVDSYHGNVADLQGIKETFIVKILKIDLIFRIH